MFLIVNFSILMSKIKVMTNDNLLHIIKIQSDIIARFGRRIVDNMPPTPEREEIIELLRELKEELKNTN
jgi:hypothetical protein